MKVAPIPPEALQSVRGLDTPKRFYQVLRSPAPLAGMPFPERPPWKAIAAAGFESIVCLTDDLPDDPCLFGAAVQFKDLVGGRHPDNPQREHDRLRDIVQVVGEELHAGRGVVVHCAGGTGRTGTVIACVLAALRLPETEVVKYMSSVNAARGKSPGGPSRTGSVPKSPPSCQRTHNRWLSARLTRGSR